MSILGERFYQMSSAVYCYGLSSLALAVYGYLRCRAGSKNTCWSSMQTIAGACSCSANTARKAVDEMELLPAVAECYDQWQTLQGEVEGYYSDAPSKKKKLSERKEFRSIKNAVVAETERLRLSALTFEDKQQPEEDGYDRSCSGWYWKMKQLLDDPSESIENKDWAALAVGRLLRGMSRVSGQLLAQTQPNGYADGPKASPENSREENRDGPQAGRPPRPGHDHGLMTLKSAAPHLKI